MAQGAQSLPHTWETQVEILDPRFDLPIPGCLGSEPVLPYTVIFLVLAQLALQKTGCCVSPARCISLWVGKLPPDLWIANKSPLGLGNAVCYASSCSLAHGSTCALDIGLHD